MDFNLCDYTTVNALLRRHGFTFSKALGQNFLVDDSVCPQMAQALCADEHTAVIEIGAGVGVLTKELCRCAGKVICIELDRRLAPVLEETLGDYDNLELVWGDVMQLDLNALLREKCSAYASVKVCANLPYYITSPVITTLLESHLPIEEIIVMVQKEAAERLCAKMGSRSAGAVTAAVAYYGDADILFEVGRESFYPSPKVDSAVIRITVHQTPPYPVENEKQFFSMVSCAFSQRRKTLLNSLSGTAGLPKDTIKDAMLHCNIPENSRAENLTMKDFVTLYEQLY